MENEKPQPGIQVISRAIAILRVLSDTPQSLGSIANATQLPRSTVQRIVDALALESLVEAGSKGVRLGWGLAEIANRNKTNIVETARPVLETLFARTHETVDISTALGKEVSFLDRIISDQELRVVSFPDKPRPLHAKANGKALLACLSNAEIERLYSDQPIALTEHTLTDLPTLLAELEKVRKSGFAYDLEEHALGVCAIGTGLIAPDGKAYAFSVAMPASRYPSVKQEVEIALQEARDMLSGLLERL
ncbi:IclR family transcriptional regulator [Marinobacterium lutimaris]|uniref:Transcriptional regulator, IclR family n=1 Tax=Marinobacterium lutimaris TaxID=568106 RepID=A0A1H6C9B2_9GAMM|nr:IclR family transcriptional regulator [Marinobacterium lutimaris]SEG69483.1 transcriptional regulator, IclR family [Marinobacterium lutimaris]